MGYYCYGVKREKIFWQKGTPLEALRLYYATEDGRCSDIPVEINIGKSYLAIVDLDFVENFKASTLDGVDTSAATTVTYESSYANADDVSVTPTQAPVQQEPVQEQPAEESAEQPAEEQPEQTAEEQPEQPAEEPQPEQPAEEPQDQPAEEQPSAE